MWDFEFTLAWTLVFWGRGGRVTQAYREVSLHGGAVMWRPSMARLSPGDFVDCNQCWCMKVTGIWGSHTTKREQFPGTAGAKSF